MESHGRVCQRAVKELPFACFLTMKQSQGNSVSSHQPGPVIVDGVRLKLGLTVAAITRLHARGSLSELFVAWSVCPGADMPISVQRSIDDVGLVLYRFFVTQAQTGDSVLAVVLHEDVRLHRELHQTRFVQRSNRFVVEEIQHVIAQIRFRYSI